MNQSIAPTESEEAQSNERRNFQIAEKEKELNSSIRRTEEILGQLTNYENGQVEDLPNLLRAFKDFVVQTSELDKKRRQREIEKEQQKMKEAEQHLQNKIRLEKLLANLNENLKSDVVAKKSTGESLSLASIEPRKSEKVRFESNRSSSKLYATASENESSCSESSVLCVEPRYSKPTKTRSRKLSHAPRSRSSHKHGSERKGRKKY